jgi:FkbH-like protein
MLFSDLVERCAVSANANPAERVSAFSALTAALREGVQQGRVAEVKEALRLAASPRMDVTTLESFRRIWAKLPAPEAPLKLAVLGGSTNDALIHGIEVFLLARGLDVQVYAPPYGTFRQEILDPKSDLYRFAPSVVFLATSRRDLSSWPETGESADRVAERMAGEVREWSTLWQALNGRLGCQIVQNNFDAPPWRLLGNHELTPSARGGYLARLNLALYDAAPRHVTIHDVDGLSAAAGRWEWGDERYYHAAKLPCSPHHLVDYAHSVASIIAAIRGKSRKCLVLDLDDTLWGGIVGDEGLGGIRLGPGDAEGEAFAAFQEYALGLRRRGVLLAVCSKNWEKNAREVFEKHPGMKLRLEDVACFVANWEDKASNLRAIARTLNIGLDALVFVDDSPGERALVRQALPAVAVPEMPRDPAAYVAAVERDRHFQVVALTKEDLQRTEFYRADVLRNQVEASSTDLETFLRSLAMVARVGPIVQGTLERSVQLINKSNQYNLTTRRYSNADVLTVMGDPGWVTLTASVSDKFGDHGLVSVVMGKVEGTDLAIDTWVMSCRVLKRSVEHYVLGELIKVARQRGLRALRGEFIPSPKNALVEDHYARLGFSPLEAGSGGRTSWRLDLGSWSPTQSFIAAAQEGT